MTTTFRKTLMATTVLAGFAIFGLDAAQAGPNGPSNIGGSISGFSSMRMDFNRVGGPSRLLARDEMRIIPLDVTKNADKGAAKKNAAKKGTDVARVSNPKSVTGGKGKEIVSNGPNLHVPAAIAEMLRLTGGNLDDISKFADIAGWLKTGPLAVPNPLDPARGDGTVTPWEFGDGGGPKGGEESDRNFLDGWAGYSSTPGGGADSSKTGWAAGDAWLQVSSRTNGATSTTVHYNKETNSYWTRTVTETFTGQGESQEGTTTIRDTYTDPNGSHVWTTKVHYDADGDIASGHNSVGDVGTATDITDGKASEKEDAEKQKAEKEKDSQPVAEGTGRPGRSGWCSPTGGCVTGSVVQGPRIIPASDASTPEMRSQLPSWATDPNPDGSNTGGGGGYNGYRPQDEEGGGIGGPGNPELSALGAPL